MDREGRFAEAKVGVFVVVALAILVFVSLWIAGSTLFRGATVPYTVVMKQSGGVRDGDRVRVSGVEVGRITRISLQPGEEWPVVVGVALDTSVTIRTDASAAVATAGLLGAAFLQIDVGSADAEILPPGGEIRGRDTMGFDDAMARVGDLSDGAIELMNKTGGILDQISERIGPILQRLEALMSEENAQSLTATFNSLEEILEENGPRFSAMLANLESASVKIDSGLEELPAIVDEISGLLTDLRTGLGDDGERLTQVLDGAAGTLSSAQNVLAVVEGNRSELDGTLRDLRDAMASLRDLAQLLKERPYSLIRIKPEPERSPGEGM